MSPYKPNSAGAGIRAAINEINQSLKPEWLRVPQATQTFGFSRSQLYELIAAGKIRSTCIKKRNALRGVRLINFDSLAAFVEKAASQGGIVE